MINFRIEKLKHRRKKFLANEYFDMILLKKVYFAFKYSILVSQRRILQKKYFERWIKGTIIKNKAKVEKFKELRLCYQRQRFFKILKMMPKIAKFQKFNEKKRKNIGFQALIFNFEEAKSRNEFLNRSWMKLKQKKDEKMVIIFFS